jgi:pyruvate, water dikinase
VRARTRVEKVAGGTTKLADRAAFDAFAKHDDVPGAANVRAMKFLVVGVDTPTPKVWLIDTNQHDYHYAFATDALGATVDLATFNRQTYFTDNRKNIAGTIVAHDGFVDDKGNKGAYAMEFWPTDPVKAKHVSVAFNALAKAMPFTKGKLAYHPAGDTQEELLKTDGAALTRMKVPVLSTTKLFEGVTYSALNQATSVGVLRVVDAANPTPFSARDILLFKGSTPNDLTHVAGIITEVPQTPLSHINLKAKQDKVPNAFIKDALKDPNIAALVGQTVKYVVGPDGWQIVAATPAELADYEQKVRPQNPQIPKPDLTQLKVTSFQDIGVADVRAFGGKTTNLAELTRILLPGQTPSPGYGIPFSFYDRFMTDNGLYAASQKMMNDPRFKTDIAFRDEALKDFRKLIRKATVPAGLASELADVEKKFPVGAAIRLRSSTNNEDLDGFNGAGLYDSYTCRTKDGETVVDEIKKVWASMWNFRAFEEREFWKIPHDKAMMAVTVHENVDGELANGVAITKNIYDENWPGFYVNSQVGENLVTNPDPLSVPEEVLVSAIGENGEYETQRIRASSMANGKSVLTDPQMQELVTALEKIQSHFKTLLQKTQEPAFAMDVEWKVLPDGHIYVKQARPVV